MAGIPQVGAGSSMRPSTSVGDLLNSLGLGRLIQQGGTASAEGAGCINSHSMVELLRALDGPAASSLQRSQSGLSASSSVSSLIGLLRSASNNAQVHIMYIYIYIYIYIY